MNEFLKRRIDCSIHFDFRSNKKWESCLCFERPDCHLHLNSESNESVESNPPLQSHPPLFSHHQLFCGIINLSFGSELGDLVLNVTTEFGFYVDTNTTQLPEVDHQRLMWLLAETYEPELCRAHTPFLSGGPLAFVMELGPRLTFTSPFSSNAVSICRNVGIQSVTRIERTRRIRVEVREMPSVERITALQDHLYGMFPLQPIPHFLTPTFPALPQIE